MSTITYKFRLYPTKEQQELLWKWSRALNDLYNHFIQLQKEKVDNHLPILRRFDTHNLIPSLKFKIENLNDVYADARQHCSDIVATLMILWQRHHINFPKFRSGYQFFNISYPDFQKSCSLKNSYFKGGKLPPIKVKIHRKIEGTIKTATIHCDERKQWWVIFVTSQTKPLECIDLSKTVGIDLGCKNLISTSDGYTIQPPKFLKRMDDAINDLKSRVDTYHKPTGSKKQGTYHMSRTCRRLKKTIRRLYGKRARMMRNFLHTRSRKIVDHYDVIVVENLRVKEMREQLKQKHDPKSKAINRIMSQNAVSMFINMLSYKAKQYLEVNPAYTSKTCASCGQVREDLTLADRTYKCSCGFEIDRDVNAALNIRNLGLLQFRRIVDDTKTDIRYLANELGYINSIYPSRVLA